MTPQAAVIAALNLRAEAMETTIGTPPLVWREKADDRPDEYVLVDHLPNLSTRPMLKSTAQDLSGIYQLTLVRRVGEFEIVYHEMAGKIAAHFMDYTSPGAFEVSITSATAKQGRPDGATHWAVPVDINYIAYAEEAS